MSVFQRLVRHFWVELKTASDVPGAAGPVGALALLMLPGLFAPIMLMPKYSPFLFFIRGQRMPNVLISARGDELMFLCFAFGAAGVTAVLKWDTLFLSSADFRNLAHLPVPLYQVLAAKVSALMLMLGAVFLAVSGPSSILFPLAISGGGPVSVSRVALAHAAGGLLSVVFVVCAITGLLGVLKLIWPEARFLPVSRILRGMLMIAAIVMMLTAPVFSDFLAGPFGSSFERLFPPAWFLSLWSSQVGLGVGNGPSALWAPSATFASAAVGGLAYYVTYLKWRASVGSAAAPPKRPPWSDRLLASLLRGFRIASAERACIRFATQTLWRSEGHWVVLSFWLGLGTALSLIGVFSSWSELPGISHSATLLGVPLCLSFTCAWGLRLLFGTAAEPACNWVFRIAPGVRRITAGKWMLRIAGIPLIILGSMPFALVGGARFGVLHTIYGVCVFLVISDLFCREYHFVPFVNRTVRQGMNPGQLFAVFAVAFCLFVVIPSALEVWVLRSGFRVAAAVAIVAAASAFGTRGDGEDWEEDAFEAEDAAEITRLDLSIRGSVFSSVLRNGR